MTPRERVLTAWAGGMPDRVPVAIWHTRLFPPDYPPLLEAEACIIVRSNVYRIEYADTAVETETFTDPEGHPRTRTTFHTPAGDLATVTLFRQATTWTLQRLFRGPADYDALIALTEATRFAPTYEQFAADDARHGEQGLARPAPIRTPMYDIIHEIMGVEAFSVELTERPERIDALYDALLARRRRALAVLADSPARIAVIEGNVCFEIVGPERFRRYHYPAIEEACALCRGRGILTGAHLDSNCRAMAPLIAATSLDCIEAFTPPPDCDLPVADARRAWAGKGLFLNFPSSVHLSGREAVLARCRQILSESAPGEALIVGVTEDTPTNEYLAPLARLVRDEGRLPLANPP
ncbi:MAG TPA: hypothetical protein VM389_00325 [Phycisphaerae bacterium]|nr:hypothetical protein [Phycisphaerae bacterium]